MRCIFSFFERAKNERTATESLRASPTAVKLRNARSHSACRFDKMLQTLKMMNHQQMQKRQRMKMNMRQRQ